MATLSSSTARAGIWLLSGKFFARALDLVSLLVLARLLDAADFGLVAIATAVLVIVEAVFDLPLVQALVRERELEASMLSTAWTLGVLRGVTICAIMVLAAWPLAWIYGDPRLAMLLSVLSLAPAMRSVFSPRLVTFMRRLDFRPDFSLDLIQKFATLIASVTVAWLTGSYWSLAIGSIAGPAAAATASYIIAPMRPAFDLSEWPRFKDIIGWNTGAQILSTAIWQIDRLLLPHFASLSSFGNFSVADSLASVPHQTFVGPLIRPLMAAFSKFEAGSAELVAAFLKATRALILVGAPLLIMLIFLAEPVVSIVAGSGWHSAGWILRWLSIAALIGLPATIMPPLAMVLDRTRFVTLRMALELLAKLPLTIFGLIHFGLMGALVARIVSNVVAGIISATLSRQLIGVGLVAQFVAIFESLVPALPMCLFLVVARDDVMALTGLQSIVAVAAAGGVALAIFWGSALAFWLLRGKPAGLEATLVEWVTNLTLSHLSAIRRS